MQSYHWYDPSEHTRVDFFFNRNEQDLFDLVESLREGDVSDGV